MASRKGGLGKGFEALFADNSTEELSSASVSTLPVGELEPNHSQPRKAFDEQALSELAESIKVHGVLQPPQGPGNLRGLRWYRMPLHRKKRRTGRSGGQGNTL